MGADWVTIADNVRENLRVTDWGAVALTGWALAAAAALALWAIIRAGAQSDASCHHETRIDFILDLGERTIVGHRCQRCGRKWSERTARAA